MRKNEKGITLVALIVTIIILVILAGIAITYAISDEGIISKTMVMELETSKGEIRDHLALILNDELLSCSADISGSATDISTRYNEVKLINFLSGYKNFEGTEHEDISAIKCIEYLEDSKNVKIIPKGGNIGEISEKSPENATALNNTNMVTEDNKIYSKYRIIPTALSAEVDKYGKGKKISDGDIFVLEAVTEDGSKIETEGAESTGKYQLNYYDKDKKPITIETFSLYMTNQS